MAVTNQQVAAVFEQLGDLLEIKGANAFRIRAFRGIAQAVANLPETVQTMLAEGTLKKVPGVGTGAIKRIEEIVEHGTCADLEQLRAELPAGLLDLLDVSGLGPKKAKLFYDELGISSVDELEAAARAGHLAGLPRMGEKSQAALLKAIEAYRRRTGRVRLAEALPQGNAIVAALAQLEQVLRIDLAGSSRRRRETIGDLDVLVAAHEASAVMDAFVALPAVRDVIARGDTKCSVRLDGGLQVDLRVLEPASYGAAMHYFTGSQLHNIAIRDRAKRKGLRVNEYGVYREPEGERIGGATEEEVFAAVGLPYIEPELRENRGEIEAAEQGHLPRLVTLEDLRGDLHMHTSASDGAASAREMALAAAERGLDYIAITDHSKALAMAHGLDEGRLRAQRDELRELEQQLGSIRLLAGVEVDILADGSLDLSREILRELDWVVGAVHSHFAMEAAAMTARLIDALESGCVDCLAHPTGRLIGQREPYAVDLDQLLRAAQRLGVAMELNAMPDRLDLDSLHCRQARELGVAVALNSDAHRPQQLDRTYGIFTARRGWLEPSDVLNTLAADEIVERHRQR